MTASATGTIVCPVCQNANPPGALFCDQCGAQLPATSPEPPGPTPPAAPAAISSTQPSQPAPSLATFRPRLVIQASGVELAIPAGQAEASVGREDAISGIYPDLDLLPHGGEQAGVSRRHARIVVQGTQCTIEDLDSTNATYVNGQKLRHRIRQPLSDGDEVRFGKLVTVFRTS